MKFGLVCECLGIAEDLDLYAWIIRMLAIMEPRWSLKDIKLIFADQLVTDILLHRLGIKETCVPRGDYHHLMNEVCPRIENFGLVFMTTIRPLLRQMLLSLYE